MWRSSPHWWPPWSTILSTLAPLITSTWCRVLRRPSSTMTVLCWRTITYVLLSGTPNNVVTRSLPEKCIDSRCLTPFPYLYFTCIHQLWKSYMLSWSSFFILTCQSLVLNWKPIIFSHKTLLSWPTRRKARYFSFFFFQPLLPIQLNGTLLLKIIQAFTLAFYSSKPIILLTCH